MGVKFLNNYIKNQNLYDEIDICDEIKNFRSYKVCEHNLAKRRPTGKPMIIFELNWFTFLFIVGTVGMLGGRHKLSLQTIRNFFKKLTNAGAVLVFFCDGQVQHHKLKEWCDRHDGNYKRSLEWMKAGSVTKRVQFRCNTFLQSICKLIRKEKLGEINVSTEVECDKALAKYAVKNKALAIFTGDTDFLIFEGKYQLWTMTSIREHILPCKAERWDREGLLTRLNLWRDQMKIFATVVGNDFTKYYESKMEYMKMNSQDAVGSIISQFKIEENEDFYRKVAKIMLKQGTEITNEHLKSVEESLKFYKLDFELQSYDKDINVLAHCFENGLPFQYDVQFMDFTDSTLSNETFIDSLLDVFCKLGGILLQKQPNNGNLKTLRIVTKCGRNEKYKQLDKLPVQPTLTETNGNDLKWNRLLWCIGLCGRADKLKKIVATNNTVITTILAITFLKKIRQINEMQSDALLLASNYILTNERLNVPQSFDYEIIRTAQAFHRAFTLVEDCIHICGLQKYIHTLAYDAVYYDSLMTKFKNGEPREPEIEKYLGKEIKIIYDRFKQSIN